MSTTRTALAEPIASALAFEGLQQRYADFKEEAYARFHADWLDKWTLLGQVIFQHAQAMSFVHQRYEAWVDNRVKYKRIRELEAKLGGVH